MKLALLFLIGAICLIRIGEAVRCYQCSGSGQNCMTGECNGNFCSKTFGKAGDASAVTKGCQDSTSSVSCSSSFTPSASIGGASCTCNTDWCNASPANARIATIFISLGVAVALGMKFLN